MFSDRGNRQRANHFHISFVNDILLLTAFGLVVFENEDDDDDILYILAYVFIHIVNIVSYRISPTTTPWLQSVAAMVMMMMR